jgi:hypothetical protein
MEKAQLLGYFEEAYNEPARDRHDHEHGQHTYLFVVRVTNQDFIFTAINSWGSCSSGWTSACWGNIQPKLDSVGSANYPDLIKPKKPTYVNVHDGNVMLQHEYQMGFDPTIEYIETTDGEKIISATGDGGCQWYSSGNTYLNKGLFESQPTPNKSSDKTEEHFSDGGGVENNLIPFEVTGTSECGTDYCGYGESERYSAIIYAKDESEARNKGIQQHWFNQWGIEVKQIKPNEVLKKLGYDYQWQETGDGKPYIDVVDKKHKKSYQFYGADAINEMPESLYYALKFIWAKEFNGYANGGNLNEFNYTIGGL